MLKNIHLFQCLCVYCLITFPRTYIFHRGRPVLDEDKQEELTTACLNALEDCALRFPEHYKSLYRLAHFYFRSKLRRNVDRARQLLLGEKGLFAHRKSSNFFNGVWRIPSNEIDRPGSFASHMSRCVLLLVDILRYTRDHKMLFDLALRFRDTPESDKKYLRDPEREELSREALSLSVQALRKKVTEAKTEQDQKAILLDVFKVYKRCSKFWEQKQALFSTILTDAYSQYKKEEGSAVLDVVVKFCTQEVAAQKASVAAAAAVSSAPQTTFSSPDVSEASSPVPYAPSVPAQQKPPPMPTAPFRRGRGRPSASSLRQQNPNAFKQMPRNSAEEMANFYRNIVTMQMSQQATNQALPLMNSAMTQQMMSAMALSQQLTYQTEMLRCQQLLLQQQAQKAAQLQALKDRSKITPPVPSSIDPSTKSMSVSASSLLAPSKVSVFSSQSILLPTSQSTKKPHANSADEYQHSMQPRYVPNKPTLPTQPLKPQPPAKPTPFQQKISSEPKVSLQHKLLSAKMAKSQITATPVAVTKPQITPSTNTDRNKQARDKVTIQSSTLPTAALSSRGVSITPAKPPEIKIPKDISIGHALSISPVTSSKNKSSLSPSTTKEVTMTILKTDQKVVKTSSSVSVSLVENKKSQLSPAGERHSPTPTLRMGSAVTITPAKPTKPVPQVKTIPKADFSIMLTKGNENKKKDSRDVIILD